MLTVEQRLLAIFRDFNDPSQEWRRQFAELLGTFVVVAAGGPMVARAVPRSVGHTATAVAPGMMVATIILFTGKTSGAHLNPVVGIAFWLRGDSRLADCPDTSPPKSSVPSPPPASSKP